jgi:hypothetical protein
MSLFYIYAHLLRKGNNSTSNNQHRSTTALAATGKKELEVHGLLGQRLFFSYFPSSYSAS